jgi:hypothetical protein
MDEPDEQLESQDPPEVRHLNVCEGDGIAVRAFMKLKDKEGPGKPSVEQHTGDDLQRSTGKWLKLNRVIDRKNNHYVEELRDPETGEILRRCEEALSEHQGHGAAKQNNTSDKTVQGQNLSAKECDEWWLL